MSQYKALLVYESILREFQTRFSDTSQGLETVLESGLGFLMSRLKLINVGIFWWDPQRNSLQMEYTIHGGTLLEGEEEILIEPESPLWKLVRDKKPVVYSVRSPWVAFIPLTQDETFVGAVRIERKTALPLGKVLSSLPRFSSQNASDERDVPF